MIRNSKKQIYAFIDSQNLNVSTQKFGWKMDWRKFHKFLADKYGVTKAFMFIGYVPESEEMYEFLHDAGFAIVLKPTFDMSRPQVTETEEKDVPKKPVKGNVDAELVLWAMKELRNYHKAIIVSGDGDFFCLVEYLEQQGKLEKLLAPNAHYSGLYKPYENYIEDLGKHRRDLAYRPKIGPPIKKK
jgi:uncharacterized LabA/DUF88 family protein